MKNIWFHIFIAMLISSATLLNAAELSYKFQLGKTYKYKYENRLASKASVAEKNTEKKQKGSPIEFAIRAIAFDNNAFVIDITSDEKTVRRYIKPTGELKGSVSEAGQHFPFFLAFPEKDLEIGVPYQTTHNIILGKKEFNAVRTLTLNAYNAQTGIAELTFNTNIKLPEVKTGKKTISLNGKISFNVNEGIVNNASWISKYSFSYYNKEMAITRDLWQFEVERRHAMILTKVEE